MPSSTSSSDTPLAGEVAVTRPGFVRLTASDRPGIAQPVPVRDIPARPWPCILAAALSLLLIAMGTWEWRMRALGLQAGDLDDGPSFWAEQRRRIDGGDVAIAILGDSRILFDTDLARFEKVTGVRPVQLAIAGSTALPFLEDLADAPKFKGLAVVGIADRSYFRGSGGLGAVALDRYRFESPAVRASFLLHRALSRVLAFLDQKYRLNALVRLLDGGWRASVQLPINERLWKLGTVTDDRQTFLWARVESDTRVRAHQRAAWGRFLAPFPAATIMSTVERTRRAVAKIRARGGEVVFVRPPSAPELRLYEEQTVSRAQGWDLLLRRAAVRGVHFDDYPAMQNLVLPEYSHLSRACATVFTDAYARAIASLTPRLTLRADAPPPLSPADCAPP
jgi:hypothetical protein